jgi:hypothetical protein
MTKSKIPHGRLIFALLLGVLSVACSPTTLPLPMLSAGHVPAQGVAAHAPTGR